MSSNVTVFVAGSYLSHLSWLAAAGDADGAGDAAESVPDFAAALSVRGEALGRFRLAGCLAATRDAVVVDSADIMEMVVSALAATESATTGGVAEDDALCSAGERSVSWEQPAARTPASMPETNKAGCRPGREIRMSLLAYMEWGPFMFHSFAGSAGIIDRQVKG